LSTCRPPAALPGPIAPERPGARCRVAESSISARPSITDGPKSSLIDLPGFVVVPAILHSRPDTKLPVHGPDRPRRPLFGEPPAGGAWSDSQRGASSPAQFRRQARLHATRPRAFATSGLTLWHRAGLRGFEPPREPRTIDARHTLSICLACAPVRSQDPADGDPSVGVLAGHVRVKTAAPPRGPSEKVRAGDVVLHADP